MSLELLYRRAQGHMFTWSLKMLPFVRGRPCSVEIQRVRSIEVPLYCTVEYILLAAKSSIQQFCMIIICIHDSVGLQFKCCISFNFLGVKTKESQTAQEEILFPCWQCLSLSKLLDPSVSGVNPISQYIISLWMSCQNFNVNSRTWKIITVKHRRAQAS